MRTQALTRPAVATLVLVLQVIPLLLFPPDKLLPDIQDWWLAALLAVMAIVADIVILIGRSDKVWPWHLISFAQGFNIISRLIMIWPHAALPGGEGVTLDVPYVVLTALSVALSGVVLWYTELPDVRINLLRRFA